MNTYCCLSFAVLHGCLVISRGETTLNVHHVTTGTNATFACTSPMADSTAIFSVQQNNMNIYDCVDISFACSKQSAEPDYTDIIFSGLGSPLATGTFTVTNPSEKRDGGVWKCQFGSSAHSNGITFSVLDPTTTATTPIASETNNEDVYWLVLLLVIACVGLVVVIIIDSQCNSDKGRKDEDKRRRKDTDDIEATERCCNPSHCSTVE